MPILLGKNLALAATLLFAQVSMPPVPLAGISKPLGTGHYSITLNLKQPNPIELHTPSRPDFDRDLLTPLKAAQKAAAEQAAAEARAQAAAALAAAQAAQVVVYRPTANYEALGQQMAAARGWAGSEWSALDAVVNMESGWNPAAKNPTSNACGIGQNINGCGAYPDPSPAGQIQWTLDYIAGRYGDPLGALAHEHNFGWY